MWSDKWTERARKEGYPARSVYKLKEANEKFRFIRRGFKVLELGASPGSWTKYVLECIGEEGLVVAIDLKPLSIPPDRRLVFLENDVFEIDLKELFNASGGKFDVLLSDMAPNTTGVPVVDQEISFNLAKKALEIAKELVRKGGFFLIKFFEGENSRELVSFAKTFSTTKLFRPAATRKSSSEIYIFGMIR
jgi:23S rRNA (uridine2552-2'-O)-methyltransferase